MSNQPHTHTMQVSAEMRQCIDLCVACHRECVETTMHCLEMGGKHADPHHIRLMQDCAQICQISADFMIRGSSLHTMTCAVCSDICTQCALDCDRVDPSDTKMRACAEMCRQCAESCSTMAKMRVA